MRIFIEAKWLQCLSDLPESKTKPGFSAPLAFTKPLPMSKGVAGDWFWSGEAYDRWAIIGPPLLSYREAVVERADPIAAGLKLGNFCLISAARPATCGAAMLVPDINAKFSPVGNADYVTLSACIEKKIA